MIQFLLRLAGTVICPTTTSSLIAAPVIPTITAITATTATSTTPTRGALAGSGGIAVDSIGSGFGDVTATATAGAICALLTTRALAARVTGRALYAVEKGVAIRVSFPAAGNEAEANGLALGVGAIEFADGLVGIAQALVCDVGDALGASSAVIDDGKGGNGADASKEVLSHRSVSLEPRLIGLGRHW